MLICVWIFGIFVLSVLELFYCIAVIINVVVYVVILVFILVLEGIQANSNIISNIYIVIVWLHNLVYVFFCF